MTDLNLRLASLIAETDSAIALWGALLESTRMQPASADAAAIALPEQSMPEPAGDVARPAAPCLIADSRTHLLSIAFDAVAVAPSSGAVVEAVARPMPPLAAVPPQQPVHCEPCAIEVTDSVAAAVEHSEQLTLIRGLDAEAAARLNAAGICRFADIAAFTSDDVTELGMLLGDGRRLSRDGWIEQAALLARGIVPLHVRRARQQSIVPRIWTIEALADVIAPAAIETAAGEVIAADAAASSDARPEALADVIAPAAIETAADEAVAADTAASSDARPEALACAAPNVIALDAVRRARPRSTRRTGTLGRVATVAAFSLMFAAAWTSIEIADGNWQALSTLVAGSRAPVVAGTF